MRYLRSFFYSTGTVLLALLVVGLTLPSEAIVERSVKIDANRATVFALLNDFRQVEKWSPWLNDDPNARIEFSGPARGVGTTVAWDGDIIGQGSQTITESVPYSRVATVLDITNQGKADTAFVVLGTAEGTEVIWSFSIDFGFNLVGRYVGLIIVGSVRDDYEEGLVNLKSMAEGLPAADFTNLEIEHLVVEATDIAFLPTSSAPQAAAMSEAMGKAYFDILGFIALNNLAEAGAPISIAREFSGSEIRFDAAIPVRGMADRELRGDASVKLGKTYEGPVIRAKHIGSYRLLGRTHDKVAAYLAALGIERNGDAWESYVGDPTRTHETQLVTYVYYPIVVEDTEELGTEPGTDPK